MSYDKTPIPVTWTHACGFREVVCGKRTADTTLYCPRHRIWTAELCHACRRCAECKAARRGLEFSR